MIKRPGQILLFVLFIVAFSCSPPQLGKNKVSPETRIVNRSPDTDDFIQGDGFTVQNIVQDELDGLSYEPDPYSQLEFVLNTGGPINVTVERSIPKNFPIGFSNVKVTPVNFASRVNTLPQGENLELFKKFLLKSQRLWLEGAQSAMWRELVKYFHEYEQKYETK